MPKGILDVKVIQQVMTTDDGWFVGYSMRLEKGSLDPKWVLGNADMMGSQIAKYLIQAVKDEMSGKAPDYKIEL